MNGFVGVPVHRMLVNHVLDPAPEIMRLPGADYSLVQERAVARSIHRKKYDLELL